MPLGGAWHFILDLTALFAVYGIVVLSLNLEAGYTGIPNFGKMMGIAIGAYVASGLMGRMLVFLYNATNPSDKIVYNDFVRENAMIVTKLNLWLSHNILMSILLVILTLLLAFVVGGILGYIAAYPAVRLRGDYLAITLLAVAEAVRIIGYNYKPIVGGTLGLQVPDPFAFAGSKRFEAATLTLIIMLVLVYIVYEKMLNTPLGRVLRAIRDDEQASESLGKDVAKYRVKVMIVGTATASLAGALYAMYTTGVIATAYNRVSWTFWPWVMLMLGGSANNRGVLAGTFVFVLLRFMIIRYKHLLESVVPFDVVWLDYILLSVALLLVLALRPQGILPERPIRTINPEKLLKRSQKRASTEPTKE